MYGRQHLASIAGRGKDEWLACTSLDESSLDGLRDDDKDMGPDHRPAPLSMHDAIVRFTAATLRKSRVG